MRLFERKPLPGETLNMEMIEHYNNPKLSKRQLRKFFISPPDSNGFQSSGEQKKSSAQGSKGIVIE